MPPSSAISWWTSPGAPTSHSRAEDRDVLAWLVWKQVSAQVHSYRMLGTPTWGEALGTAVSTPSTLVARWSYHSLCPQLMMRESFMSCTHTPRSGTCAALDTLLEDTIPVCGSAFTYWSPGWHNEEKMPFKWIFYHLLQNKKLLSKQGAAVG